MKANEITGTGCCSWTLELLEWLLNFSSFCPRASSPAAQGSKLCKSLSLASSRPLALQIFGRGSTSTGCLSTAPCCCPDTPSIFSNFGSEATPSPVCHPNPSSGKYLGTSSSPAAALQGCSPCKELSAKGPADGFCWFKPHGVNENSSHLLQEHAPDWDYKLVCFAKHLQSIFQIIIILRSSPTLPQCIFIKLKARALLPNSYSTFIITCPSKPRVLCNHILLLRAEMLSIAWNNKILFCPEFT